MRSSVRLFVFTGKQQADSRGSDVSITFVGTLGNMIIENLEHGNIKHLGSLFGAGSMCEIEIEADYIGTIQAVQIAYGVRVSAGDCSPWFLKQINVQTEYDGLNICFLSPYERLDGNTKVELRPHLVWHQDRYGTISEKAPPPAQPIGQWMWPELPLPVGGAVASNQAEIQTGSNLQLALWQTILREEVTPLIDDALFNLEQKRIPGTFLNACVKAIHGNLTAPVDAIAMEELLRRNAELSSELVKAKQQIAPENNRPALAKASESASSSCIVS